MAVRFVSQKILSETEKNTESAMNFVVAKRPCRPIIQPLGRYGESPSSLKQPEISWGFLNVPKLFRRHFPQGKTPQHGEDCPYATNIPHCDAPLAATSGLELSTL